MKNIKLNMTFSRLIHRSSLLILLLIAFMSFSRQGVAQRHEVEIINKGELFATASILQDFDDDGDVDIIITRRRSGSGSDTLPAGVEWLENDGTGQFPRHELFQDLVNPGDIDAADFDNDGDIDYIVSDKKQTTSEIGDLVLFLRQDDLTFTRRTVEAGVDINQSDVADFDSNGTMDIVSVGFDLSTVNLYLNDGLLNFAKEELVNNVNQVVLVEADDIDNDGDHDIIYGAGSIFALLSNNGDAEFEKKELFTDGTIVGNVQVSSASGGIAISDINNDGKKDILTFSFKNEGGLFFLDGDNGFSSSLIDKVDVDAGGDIVVADIDGNGLKDIIRQHVLGHFLSILYQDSDMQFRSEFLEQNWDNRSSNNVGPQMQVGDLDDDGDTDLVFPEGGNVDGDLSWFENIDGKLYCHYLHSAIQAARISKLGDMDNDGDLDIVLTAGDDSASPSSRENEIVWYENRGDKGFIEWRIDDNILFPTDMELDDLDKDGILDIIIPAKNDNSLFWYKKNGINWEKNIIDDNVKEPMGCAVADIDSDNDKDIVLCSPADHTVFLYLNSGTGDFTRQVVDITMREPRDVEIADLDGANGLDLVVVSRDTDNSLVTAFNRGDQSFQEEILFQGQEAFDVEVGDWDKNGSMDIISAFAGRTFDRDVIAFLNNNAEFTDFTLTDKENLMSGLAERSIAIKLADIDNDEDLDLIFSRDDVSSRKSNFGIGFNQDGIIESIEPLFEGHITEIFAIDTGDVNGDNIMDVVAANAKSNNLLLFVGNDVPDITPTPSLSPTPTASPTPTPPISGKSFTFKCEHDLIMGKAGIEKLMLSLGESENCILKLTNIEPNTSVEVLTNIRPGLISSISVTPVQSKTNTDGEIEFTIKGINKGFDLISWAVSNKNGKTRFNKKAYNAGNAWGMGVEVQ